MAEPTQRAAIRRVRSLSPLVREMGIAPLERTFSFQPGQWVSLRLPVGPHPPLIRAYSLAEPPSESGELLLVFDRVPQGLGSGYLFGLKEGDEVTVSGPYGKFALPDSLDHDLLFFARFTGVVPIRCMLRHLLDRAHQGPVTLAYSIPHQTEMIYHDEFTAQAAARPNFRYLWAVSQSDDEEKTSKPVQEWPLIGNLIPYLTGRRDFVPMICGVKTFVRPLRAFFLELGLDRRAIRVETYD
jgi:ferredoxin-NADP reductase